MFLPIGSNIPQMRFPWMTISWILLSVILFFGITYFELDRPFEETRTYHWAVVPAGQNEAWRFISYQFMHSSLSHLIANVWYLAIFGWILESAIGGAPFLILSLLGGGLAVMPERFFQLNPELPVIGASGAVAFMMGAVFALFPWSRVRLLIAAIPVKNFPMSFFMPIRYLIYFWLVIQISGLAMSLWLEPAPVAYSTHLTGLALGVLAGMALRNLVSRDFFDIELMGVDLKKFYESLDHLKNAKVQEASQELMQIAQRANLRPQVQQALFKLSLQHQMKELSDVTWKRMLSDWLWLRNSKALISHLKEYFETFKVMPPMETQQRVKALSILNPNPDSEIVSKLRVQQF